jgi:hypothetical protein
MSTAQAMAAADNGTRTKNGRPETIPMWMDSGRYWEAAETTRLNSAHWTHADDESINVWLMEHLSTLRERSVYEARNNGIVLGMQNTHSEDIVGQDGPTLQVLSDDDRYNSALEQTWQDWFAAPTTRPNVSGAAMMKLWVRNLWKCGEYLARIITDPNADGPISMRLWPCHPRRLATPTTAFGNDNIVMGVEFDQFSRPKRYWIDDQVAMGTSGMTTQSDPWPADLMIHEFLIEEEDQVRGVPLQSTGLQSSADLRDFDDQVQDAARQMADQAVLLYTTSPDAPYWELPESSTVERRTIKMAPPHWQPWVNPATQPPVQYPDYRAERQIELGRPVGMPRLMVRLDASKHSWASARLDMTTYRRAVGCFQAWFSGSEKSCGTLNRLVDEVAKEGRFTVPELRRTPPVVIYQWTWPLIDEVEPFKTAKANEVDLRSRVKTLTDILTSKKKTLSQHVEELRREREAFEQAGLPLPGYMEEAEETAAMMTEGE